MAGGGRAVISGLRFKVAATVMVLLVAAMVPIFALQYRWLRDVIVMDVALPGLPGYEAASVLKHLDPTVEVILTAGTEVAASGETHHVEHFRCFAKPLDLEALSRAVADRGDGDVAEPGA